MLRITLLIIVASLLSSCAKPPLQEMDAAEYLVERAYSMQAMEFAPTEYTAARTALNDAREAMQDKDYGDAEDSIEFALQHARRAIVLTEEGKAKRAEEEAMRIREAEERRAELEKARALEAAYREEQKVAPRPAPKPEPKQKPVIEPASSYIVGEGENLWTISAQPQVYNEGLLWPLLYQANRDQIKDPRQIFPGQSLSIRRDMTEADLEAARQTARESKIFPVP